MSRLIEHYGVGVAHIALRVDDAHATAQQLRECGVAFDTDVIEEPGDMAANTLTQNKRIEIEAIGAHGRLRPAAAPT